MENRIQRSKKINTARYNLSTPDAEQVDLLKKHALLGTPQEEKDFAVFGIVPNHLKSFWINRSPIGVDAALREIINSSFPEFIKKYKLGETVEDLHTHSHEALFHRILEILKLGIGKGLITNPKNIRKELSASWRKVEFLHSDAATHRIYFYKDPCMQQIVSIVSGYYNGTDKFKNFLTRELQKNCPLKKTHVWLMQLLVFKLLGVPVRSI